MCLIALACNVHPDYPLLLVANRDEFHARAAAPLAWWTDAPSVLAGRDLAEGGSWLGASRSGRVAAVTNVRDPTTAVRGAQSRGRLVADFLAASTSADDFGAALQAQAADYGGFNLLLHDGRALRYLSNRPAFAAHVVEPGVHALSNAQLDTPWPKSQAAHAAMQNWIARDLIDEEALLAAMGDPAPAPDTALPSTGVGIEMERLLSPAFIRTPNYGTRCTSLLKISRSGELSLRERRYAPDGSVSGETGERFVVRAPQA